MIQNQVLCALEIVFFLGSPKVIPSRRKQLNMAVENGTQIFDGEMEIQKNPAKKTGSNHFKPLFSSAGFNDCLTYGSKKGYFEELGT